MMYQTMDTSSLPMDITTGLVRWLVNWATQSSHATPLSPTCPFYHPHSHLRPAHRTLLLLIQPHREEGQAGNHQEGLAMLPCLMGLLSWEVMTLPSQIQMPMVEASTILYLTEALSGTEEDSLLLFHCQYKNGGIDSYDIHLFLLNLSLYSSQSLYSLHLHFRSLRSCIISCQRIKHHDLGDSIVKNNGHSHMSLRIR